MKAETYTGRFAPSPTGPLHDGSLLAALASWLDSRAHAGRWLVRIEDIDTPRCVPGAADTILRQLAACGLHPDEPPLWQSQQGDRYRAALQKLQTVGLAYPCACSRSDILTAWAARGVSAATHAGLPYPGTCRDGLHGRAGRAWRLRTDISMPNRAPAQVLPRVSAMKFIVTPLITREDAETAGLPQPQASVRWLDRRLGPQTQNVAAEVGDFVLLRADGMWAYQLAVVADDAAQGVTDVVRGLDLLDNTGRQILLQRALGLPTPRYLHTPLVCGDDGAKLSKQNGARPFDSDRSPAAALLQAGARLGLTTENFGPGARPATLLERWIPAWKQRFYNPPP